MFCDATFLSEWTLHWLSSEIKQSVFWCSDSWQLKDKSKYCIPLISFPGFSFSCTGYSVAVGDLNNDGTDGRGQQQLTQISYHSPLDTDFTIYCIWSAPFQDAIYPFSRIFKNVFFIVFLWWYSWNQWFNVEIGCGIIYNFLNDIFYYIQIIIKKICMNCI